MDIALIFSFFCAAQLYSSVGHGGASGYLAVMAMLSFAPESMRATAVLMNVAVASIAWFNYWRADYFRWQLFWPLALLAVPCAYLGGRYSLPPAVYERILGAALIFSALYLLKPAAPAHVDTDLRTIPTPLALGLGASLGVLAGLTGIGGGIFLSPVLIFARFATSKGAGAIAAGFIVLNSLAGLLAQAPQVVKLPSTTGYWVLSAVCGALIGSRFGAFYCSGIWIRRLLAVVLLIAAVKLVF